ncbi:MAG: hypothetical protein ACLRWF_09345 [Ruthenibacterium sp.]
MKVIISPAKNMVQDADTLPPAAMPVFLEDARISGRRAAQHAV